MLAQGNIDPFRGREGLRIAREAGEQGAIASLERLRADTLVILGDPGADEALDSAMSVASDDWLRIERGYGRDAVAARYAETLVGKADPAQGTILSMWNARE